MFFDHRNFMIAFLRDHHASHRQVQGQFNVSVCYLIIE